MNNDEVEKSWIKIAAVSILTGLGLIFLVGIGLQFSGLHERAAQFGDFFNVANSLLSAAALLGAIYAVILQQRELKQAREDQMSSIKAQESNAESQERIAQIHAYTTLIESNSSDMLALSKRIEMGEKLTDQFTDPQYGAIERNGLNLVSEKHFPNLIENLRIIGLIIGPESISKIDGRIYFSLQFINLLTTSIPDRKKELLKEMDMLSESRKSLIIAIHKHLEKSRPGE